MGSNRAVDHFRYQQEMSIQAHGIAVWAADQVGHIAQEAETLAGRVYNVLSDIEAFLTSSPTDDVEKARLCLELGSVSFRIGAVRDVVEATNASLTEHGKNPSAELTGWVYILNGAEPVIAQAKTTLNDGTIR